MTTVFDRLVGQPDVVGELTVASVAAAHLAASRDLEAHGGTPDDGPAEGSEFVLVTPFKTLRAVELLAMVVYFSGVQERIEETYEASRAYLEEHVGSGSGGDA